MGTSASQPSPRSPQWDLVRRSYTDPSVPPSVTVSRIVSALSDDFVRGLSAPPVAQALGSLLGLAAEIEAAGDDRPRLTAAARKLRTQAKEATVRSKTASRFGELALSAATKTVLHGESGRLGRRFVVRYVTDVFGYLVSRDIGRYMGRGRFRGLSEVPLFVGDVESHVQATLDRAELADPPDVAAPAELEGYLQDAIAACLALLSREEEAGAD